MVTRRGVQNPLGYPKRRTKQSVRKAALMSGDQNVLITLGTSPSSDSWGFVGVVSVGDFEAYRTIRAYPVPGDALRAAQQLLAGVLGSLMAGQEWRSAQEEFGHAPLRSELGLGWLAPPRDSTSASTPDGDSPQPSTTPG